MAIFSINYDLNSPGQNYERVNQAVGPAGRSIRVLYSTFLIDFGGSASDLWSRICGAFDRNDRCLISEVTTNRQGWMSQDIWDWLNAHR